VTGRLQARIADGLASPVASPVRNFAERLARKTGALAILFYGSNLRTGSLEGVLDYYLLLPGKPERGIWPQVSYHEWAENGLALRAKVAAMTLAKFSEAASGALIDTTIWARFVQPSALVWRRDETAGQAVIQALADASATAARLAVVLGPERATADEYWAALFQATYRAELRVEGTDRAQSILALNAGHFGGLLPLALEAAGIAFDREGELIVPAIDKPERARVKRWWRKRRRLGKPLNLLRLLRAAHTFEGAARYAAWKVERHTGMRVELTPWRERHPILAAPGVLWSLWRTRRKKRGQQL
jgi:hypothetical protein